MAEAGGTGSGSGAGSRERKRRQMIQRPALECAQAGPAGSDATCQCGAQQRSRHAPSRLGHPPVPDPRCRVIQRLTVPIERSATGSGSSAFERSKRSGRAGLPGAQPIQPTGTNAVRLTRCSLLTVKAVRPPYARCAVGRRRRRGSHDHRTITGPVSNREGCPHPCPPRRVVGSQFVQPKRSNSPDRPPSPQLTPTPSAPAPSHTSGSSRPRAVLVAVRSGGLVRPGRYVLQLGPLARSRRLGRRRSARSGGTDG